MKASKSECQSQFKAYATYSTCQHGCGSQTHNCTVANSEGCKVIKDILGMYYTCMYNQWSRACNASVDSCHMLHSPGKFSIVEKLYLFHQVQDVAV